MTYFIYPGFYYQGAKENM